MEYENSIDRLKREMKHLKMLAALVAVSFFITFVFLGIAVANLIRLSVELESQTNQADVYQSKYEYVCDQIDILQEDYNELNENYTALQEYSIEIGKVVEEKNAEIAELQSQPN